MKALRLSWFISLTAEKEKLGECKFHKIKKRRKSFTPVTELLDFLGGNVHYLGLDKVFRGKHPIHITVGSL